MHMPGFTADASLSRTEGSIPRGRGFGADGQRRCPSVAFSGTVMHQQMRVHAWLRFDVVPVRM